MAKYVINKSTLTGIADAIRSKEGSTAAIPVLNMKERILNIKTGVDTSDATATEGDVVSPKTFYARGKKYTGNIPSKAAATITPGTKNVVISKNQYLAGDQTIKGDPDLKPENIKSGVNIFGVLGTMSAGASYTGTIEVADPESARILDIDTGVTVSTNDSFVMFLDDYKTDISKTVIAACRIPKECAMFVEAEYTSNDGVCFSQNAALDCSMGLDTGASPSTVRMAVDQYMSGYSSFAFAKYRWILIKGQVIS